MSLNEIAALIIWWCEGTKPRRDLRWKNSILTPIEITNGNPKIIKIFLNYLINNYGIPLKRIKGQLQIHEGDNKIDYENYWSKETGIPVNQFNKTIIRKIGNKPNKNKGTFKLRLYDKILYNKLKTALDSYLESENNGV